MKATALLRSASALLDAQRFCRHMSRWHLYLVRRLECTSMAADRIFAESVSHAGRWVVESWCDWGCVRVGHNYPKFFLYVGYGTLSRSALDRRIRPDKQHNATTIDLTACVFRVPRPVSQEVTRYLVPLDHSCSLNVHGNRSFGTFGTFCYREKNDIT